MATINLNGLYLKSALVGAADKDVRYYLKGVLVEIMARETRVVATDGHRIILLRAEVADGEPDQAVAEIIIPREVVKNLKISKRFPTCELTYAAESQENGVSLSHNGVTVMFVPVDGKFPDYRRAIPTQQGSGVQAHFNLGYLADMTKAVHIAFDTDKGQAEVWHNGDSCAIVTCAYSNFIGAVMPLRGSKSAEIPAWIQDSAPEKLHLAA